MYYLRVMDPNTKKWLENSRRIQKVFAWVWLAMAAILVICQFLIHFGLIPPGWPNNR